MGWLWGTPRHRGRVEPPRWSVAEHERLTLHYPSPWRVKQLPGEFAVRCSLEVIDLAELFGFAFPKPVQVYVFPTCEWLSRFYGHETAAGVAVAEQTAVAVALDAGNVLQVIRHELAHLYSYAWGPYHPAFKGEGMAVWCEYKRDRELVDREVQYCLFTLGVNAGVSLPLLETLIDDGVFMHPRNRSWNYALAGSFTRWVVRQRGWPIYRDFYRTATPASYVAEFVSHFGMTLSAAETGWHRHLYSLCRGRAKLGDRPPRWGIVEPGA